VRVAATVSIAASVILVLLAGSVTLRAQAPAKVYRVGVLTGAFSGAFPDALRPSLRDLGYVEGQNLIIDIRETEGQSERTAELAAELARVKSNVIIATYPGAVLAARHATTTIPIVMVNSPDPVQLGLVTSLARPGGNITGVTSLSVDVTMKQLELLKEVAPRISRIAVLANQESPWHPLALKGLREGHRSLGVQLQILEVRGPADVDPAFQSVVRERAGAVLVLADPLLFAQRRRLADLAIKHRIPLMGSPLGYVEAGGLLSYWADQKEQYRRVASYVDRILKGAAPGSLPIEQPGKYELLINTRTAKALGLTIPPALLQRADRLIE
jgi:putative tryptophan/tyrosine transport system substrate-binding protein